MNLNLLLYIVHFCCSFPYLSIIWRGNKLSYGSTVIFFIVSLWKVSVQACTHACYTCGCKYAHLLWTFVQSLVLKFCTGKNKLQLWEISALWMRVQAWVEEYSAIVNPRLAFWQGRPRSLSDDCCVCQMFHFHISGALRSGFSFSKWSCTEWNAKKQSLLLKK